MINNLLALARQFRHSMDDRASSNQWRTLAALTLCHADMGAAAVQRHMPEKYHDIVTAARKWLRTACSTCGEPEDELG